MYELLLRNKVNINVFKPYEQYNLKMVVYLPSSGKTTLSNLIKFLHSKLEFSF